MLAVLSLAFALQQVTVRVGAPSEQERADSIKRQMTRDSIRYEAIERGTATCVLCGAFADAGAEASAFLDPAARTLLLRARDARLRQDSSLLNYDAKAYQRLSVGMGFRAVGRQRLLFRTETASRVRWSRAGGVHIDLNGARTVFPAAKDEAGEVSLDEATPIPYYPGREALWVGSGTARAEVDENELVHPIALGAEAY
jgi:hypothetical protein